MQKRILLKTKWAKHGQLWENEIAEEDKTNFFGWAKELEELKDVKLNWNYFTSKLASAKLHLFSDASLKVMCMFVYFKAETKSGVQLCFVVRQSSNCSNETSDQSKTGSPSCATRFWTWRAFFKVYDNNVKSIYHWTDLYTVLQWMCSAHKKLKLLVANRIEKIPVLQVSTNGGMSKAQGAQVTFVLLGRQFLN